jgi:hypothetical protein
LKCRQLGKLCPSKGRTTFILADFEVLRWNLENSAKVLRGFKSIRDLTMPLTEFWPQVSVDSVNKVIRGCWIGFRSDDPGGP